ncbi:hypothetical protein [Streptococcus parauberis]|uniref:hypothetical protein n=1 Tax=Streptococcus parauberis TaxID=1348 RepID=UPI000E308561|nr:hypothetical protein [Streptococcus parauberis]RFE01068.1 hypothetical protein ADO06_01941 [Streptococcus parauberis]
MNDFYDEITELIQFKGFNSKDFGLFLLERDAPTPDEKEIIESIPLMQGELDFSMLTGDRIFESRELKYKFIALTRPYSERKILENTIKRLVMPHGKSNLYDTHDGKFFWYGKCKSVDVDDDAEYDCLTVVLTFKCYPLMYSYYDYFDDYFDNFNLDSDTAAFTKFPIAGATDILLYNPSDTAVSPKVIVSSQMTVTDDLGISYTFKTGTSVDYVLTLKRGINKLKVTGNGTIAFHFRSEVMA